MALNPFVVRFEAIGGRKLSLSESCLDALDMREQKLKQSMEAFSSSESSDETSILAKTLAAIFTCRGQS